MSCEVEYDEADTISICTMNLEEEIQNYSINDTNQLKNLGKQFSHLHSNFLYYRHKSDMGRACYESWKNIVLLTAEIWEKFGLALGVSEDEINYIKYSHFENPTDTVLKVFIQNKNATLDKVLNTYVKLERYDILSKMRTTLNDLLTHLEFDSGYMSNDNNTRRIISNHKYVSDLPAVLNKTANSGMPNTPNQQNKLPQIRKRDDSGNCYTLLLTFAEDGCKTADNIKEYVKQWDDFPGVKVITLDDIKDKVQQNAGKYIREYFEKADYVVPILTPGYFERIKSEEPCIINNTERLDFQYVNFIFNVMTGYYNGSGCLNTKIRSVVPQKVDFNVIMTILKMFPEFQPWTHESKFDEQFKVYLEYK